MRKGREPTQSRERHERMRLGGGGAQPAASGETSITSPPTRPVAFPAGFKSEPKRSRARRDGDDEPGPSQDFEARRGAHP